MKFVFHACRFNRPFGILCSILTDGPWSHGSFITNNGKHFDTTAGRGYLDIRTPEPDRRCLVYDVPDFVLNEEDMQDLIGKKYDLLGLIFYPLGVQDGSKLFCSESQVAAAKLAGLDMSSGKPTPKKMIKVLEKITQGVIMKESYLIEKNNEL